MFRIFSNLWHQIYNLVSFFYPDSLVAIKGQQQLLSLPHTHCASQNIISAKNYYLSDNQIQVLTWNIHHGLDWLMRPRLLEIAEYLQVVHYNIDVICLQEVDTTFVFIPGYGLVNQASYLAAQLGYHCYYHNDLAILSKAPIIQELVPIYIPPEKNDSNKFATQVIGCVIRVNDRDIRVYNCHLPNDIFGYEQWKAITNTHNGLLTRILNDTYNNIPVIVTGDFNSIELFTGIQNLKKITTRATNKHPSYPVIVPLIQLDYILTNGEWVDGLKILSSTADYNCHLSDHYPIEALISI
jgi:endonuclease/exonuclease/phosphatase family metal-dependent hydrolase